jgi:hypothetical protein
VAAAVEWVLLALILAVVLLQVLLLELHGIIPCCNVPGIACLYGMLVAWLSPCTPPTAGKPWPECSCAVVGVDGLVPLQ